MLLLLRLLLAAVISTAAAQYAPALRAEGPLLDPRHAVRIRGGRRSAGGAPKIVTWNMTERAVNGSSVKRKYRVKRQAAGSEPPVPKTADYRWVWKDLDDFRGLAYFIEGRLLGNDE
jgi:hypothetical protein